MRKAAKPLAQVNRKRWLHPLPSAAVLAIFIVFSAARTVNQLATIFRKFDEKKLLRSRLTFRLLSDFENAAVFLVDSPVAGGANMQLI
jgi:hypothetical protein